MTHGSCTAVALPEGDGRPGPEISSPSGNQRGAGVVPSVNTIQGIWCAEKRRHLTYLCENRSYGRPPSSVVAADNVCVLIPCISSSAHLQACSSLRISVEGTSVYKLHQRWSFLNIRCSIELHRGKVELLGALCWTESCGWSVLSCPFSCFCRCSSTHGYAKHPAVSWGS